MRLFAPLKNAQTISLRTVILAAAATTLFFIFSVWIFWFIAFTNEIERMKHEIYLAVSKSMGDVITESFNKNHASLLKYQECEVDRMKLEAINKDLSKIISGKMALEPGMKIAAKPKPVKKGVTRGPVGRAKKKDR